jgi:ABC-type Mn2+/Zn2+ transport system ATPase subunit/ABC-type Zn uptake system ZnuABC Zn-binding protein ZnuA
MALVLALSAQAQKPKVVCTTTIIYDITRNIGGEHIEAISFLPIGGDPHIYEARPDDVKMMTSADLVLRNGLHLEGWLDKVIFNSGTRATSVTVTAGIEPIVSANLHGAEDPHAWMDITNGITMANNIKNALAQLMPEKESAFLENFRSYREKLEELDQYIFDRIATIDPEKRILVTTHDAFHYYAERYGMRVESIQGISTDAEIMVADATRVREVVRVNDLPAIFIESTINPEVFVQISKDLHVKIGGELFADSIGEEDTEAGTYLGMLKHNTDVIVLGLTGGSEGMHAQEADSTFLLMVLLVFVVTFALVARFVKLPGKRGLDWRHYTIDIENLTVTYGTKTVLSNVNLTMPSGQVYGVIGPNGSGKSTMFKSLLGLIVPDSGRVTINGAPVDRLSIYTAYIPQKEEIDFDFPATVFDVVLNGRYPHKKIFSRISKGDIRLAEECLRKVDMFDFRHRQIGQLSGGQQQRVFMARALAQEAEVLLLDEPFSGVDVTTEEKLIGLLRDLAAQGKTVLVIHHDLSDVHEYFDQVIMLNQRLIAFGPTKQTFTDENIRQCYHGRSAIMEEVGLIG